MLHVITSSKGGVGKTTVATSLCCIFYNQNKKFKIIELDNNNSSLKYQSSDIFIEENSKSLKLKKKGEAISGMLFDLMSDETIEYIIDIGGGDDTFEILDAIKSLDIEKTYYIPTTKIKKYLSNAHDTFEYIHDPENTMFVLNQYNDLAEIRNEFKYFFGNKKMGIKAVSENFSDDKFLGIPFSDYFQIAEDDEMSILDLALISQNITEKENRSKAFEDAKGDRKKFENLLTQYWNSQEAFKVFEEIEQNFWSLSLDESEENKNTKEEK